MPLDMNEVNWQEFPLFHGVEDEVARRFVAAGFHFQYETGTPLINNNDLGETFFMIMNGLAKLVLVNAQQEEVNVVLFKTGDFFGELSMLEPMPVRSANVIAVSNIDVLAVQKKDFLRLMHQYPQLALNIARVLGQRLRAMNERMVTERLSNDLAKVAHTFLLMAKKGTAFNEQGTVLMPLLSLKEWALFCYTSKESFMENMEKLKTMGALEWQNQRIAITNIEALRRCAEPHQQTIDGSPHTS